MTALPNELLRLYIRTNTSVAKRKAPPSSHLGHYPDTTLLDANLASFDYPGLPG